jgi:hypothetical protein
MGGGDRGGVDGKGEQKMEEEMEEKTEMEELGEKYIEDDFQLSVHQLSIFIRIQFLKSSED